MPYNHLDYESDQQKFKVRVGDIVTVFKIPGPEETDAWCTEMDALVGQSGKVIDIISDGINVRFQERSGIESQQNGWWVPYTCLRIIR
jgi:hypothetical protein